MVYIVCESGWEIRATPAEVQPLPEGGIKVRNLEISADQLYLVYMV